jgi:hypothetical protein
MANAKVNVVTTQGVLPLELSDDERSTAAQHVNAATAYRDTGDDSGLGAFRGITVGGHELETDPDQIEFLAAQGQLDFEDFYEN